MAKKPILKAADLPAEDQTLFFVMLGDWYTKQSAAAAAVVAENEARIALVNKFFPTALEGTTTMVLGHGKELKLDVRINRTVESTQYDGLKAFLDNYVDDGTNPEQTMKVRKLQGIVDSCIRLKPEVVVGGFKELDKDDKLLISDVIIEKLGTPGLKIHTPTAK